MPRRLWRVEKREKCTEMMEMTAMVVATPTHRCMNQVYYNFFRNYHN